MKLVSCSILLAASSLTWAEIAYQVDVHPDKESLHVTMTLPKTGKGARLQIPNWAPGAYVLRDNFKSVLNLRATDGKGKVLKIETQMETLQKPYEVSGEKRVAENSVCTWTVEPAPQTMIEYDINLRVTDGAMHWSGPSTYLYEVNRLREKCRIVIKTPEGWPVYIGLDEVKNSPQVYTAKDYDVLADNPVTVGSVLVDEYVSRNRPHFIVMRGAAKSMVDRQKLRNACKLVSDFQGETFGDFLPMNKYVWHFDVNPGQDGAGGLEHLSSTQISLAAGVGPRAVSVISHEYFHLWNVKRIRSKVLGPFDYTRLPETGAIWWLEGVTDYYAHYLLYRFSFSDEADFFADIVSNFNAVRRNPAHLEISPYASSFRVGESSNGRGNSNGYRISYYNQGWLVGMVLDLAIRTKTQGKKSLDNVLINLWNLCKRDGPGFEEDEIRKQLIRVGGTEMGDLYDRIVMKPGDPLGTWNVRVLVDGEVVIEAGRERRQALLEGLRAVVDPGEHLTLRSAKPLHLVPYEIAAHTDADRDQQGENGERQRRAAALRVRAGRCLGPVRRCRQRSGRLAEVRRRRRLTLFFFVHDSIRLMMDSTKNPVRHGSTQKHTDKAIRCIRQRSASAGCRVGPCDAAAMSAFRALPWRMRLPGSGRGGGEMPLQGLQHRAVGGIRGDDDGAVQTQSAGLLRGARVGDDQRGGAQQRHPECTNDRQQLVQTFAARHQYGIDRVALPRCEQLRRIGPGLRAPVHFEIVDLRAARQQRLAHVLAAAVAAQDQHAPPRHPLQVRQRQQRLAGELARRMDDLQAPRRQGARRGAADRGDRHPRRPRPRCQRGEGMADRIGADEDRQIVLVQPRQAGLHGGGVARGQDVEHREAQGTAAGGLDHAAQRPGLMGGARHQNGAAGERRALSVRRRVHAG